MRERTSRAFTRLSPGSTPFFLPRWGGSWKKRQPSAPSEDSAFATTLEERQAADFTLLPGGTATRFDPIWIGGVEWDMSEQVANLRRHIEIAATSKQRRMKARSKRRP